MSRLSPKPIIAQVYQTWDVPPGMKIALVEDMERNVWVVESCPAGTHFWTLTQARELPLNGRTGQALRAAIAAGSALNQPSAPLVSPRALPMREKTGLRRQAGVSSVSGERSEPMRSQRQATRGSKTSVCA